MPICWRKPMTPKRPKIVCLCGSTRFLSAFNETNLTETLAGNIVLSIGCVTHSDLDLGFSDEIKDKLDELHLRKIDLADEIIFLNVNDYIGISTSNELAYAVKHKKKIRFLEGCDLEEFTG